AFALHKGHITQGALIAARRTTADKVVSGTNAWLQDSYNGNDLVHTPGGTPPEVFAAGRVTVGFKGGDGVEADLSKLWQKDAKTVKSSTGELLWDYGREHILVGSVKTQGVIGKCGGPLKLPAVDLDVKTGFVSVIFTPLDDQPLAKSKHILITALGQDKQTGAKYSDDGTKLLSTGTAPLLMEPVQATIKLAGTAPSKVRPLDYYGVPMKTALEIKDGAFVIDGRSRAYYYEVLR
ncbi:MAG TPA: hypothetical protein VHM91_14150, partial [Verrucomicrobiales bacterium]|nr:hypothetical protein [Verrucomicrobiales bacterium]